VCAENIERLRASFSLPSTITSTTTTGSSEEINYSQALVSGCRRESIHPERGII